MLKNGIERERQDLQLQDQRIHEHEKRQDILIEEFMNVDNLIFNENKERNF